MSDTLYIGATPVTIGADDITFPGTGINVNQYALVAPTIPPPPPLALNQLVMVSVQAPPPPAVTINQFAMILVVGPNQKVVTPDFAIQLECWQPCLSYGSPGFVYWKEPR